MNNSLPFRQLSSVLIDLINSLLFIVVGMSSVKAILVSIIKRYMHTCGQTSNRITMPIVGASSIRCKGYSAHITEMRYIKAFAFIYKKHMCAILKFKEIGD